MLALIIFCSFHSWCYDKKTVFIQTIKTLQNIAKCKKTATTDNISSVITIYNPSAAAAAETNSKFFEKKSLLIGAGHITIFTLSAVGFSLPTYFVRRIARQNVHLLNFGLGRMWVYLTQLSLRFFYLNVFPAMVILSNSKMKKSLWRIIKNVLDNI
jgi:hypothetical protein